MGARHAMRQTPRIMNSTSPDTAKTWMRDAVKISRCAQRLGES
jgi:hypothetical protein